MFGAPKLGAGQNMRRMPYEGRRRNWMRGSMLRYDLIGRHSKCKESGAQEDL